MLVLETDEPHPDDHNEKGSYSEILSRHFKDAGKAHDPPLAVETEQIFVVKEKGGRVPTMKDFEGIHAVLITGSMYDAHGDDDWIVELMDRLKGESCPSDIWATVPMLTSSSETWTTRPDIRYSGVCFGHQLLARMLGSSVEPHPKGEWEIGHHRIDLSPIGRKLFKTDDDHIFLHQMHQDYVAAPPSPSHPLLASEGDGKAEVHVWGHSPHTGVQGLYIPKRIFSTQAHMAFDEAMVKREIEMRVESGAIEDKALAEEAKDTAHLEHDGEAIAKAILRFFHGEDDGF